MEPSTPLKAEEEALKKNTDCIYFLASPLTCKKGNECEFRHSEAARVNPKDCWFWLNGNCLNPKCAFRHPPLDGLFGVPGTPSGLQAVTNAPGAYNPIKQGVACIFFQKGQCLKGEWCPFVHVPLLHPASNQDQSASEPHLEGNSELQQLISGPHAAGNHVQQQVAKVSASFSGTSQLVPWGIKECNAVPEQAVPKVAASKPVEFLYSPAKSAHRAEGPPVNALLLKKSPSPYPAEYEPPRSQPTVALVSSDSTPGMPHHQLQAAEEHYSNGREADEFLGESSPGFDVLVDGQEDYGRESEYYHNEDEYGRASVHGGRNLNQSVNDFDYHHRDYEAIPSFDGDQYNGKGDYERRYGRARMQFERDYRRASSERAMNRISKRRPQQRESSPDEIDGLDLRHRLLKQRRLGPKSPPHHARHHERHNRDDRYVEDRYRGRSSGRDRERDRRHVPQESSLSSRLQGRITLPARSPPPHRSFELQPKRDRESGRPSKLQSERARERGRSRDRLSPLPRTTNYKGRLQDRIKRAPTEEFSSDGRSFGARPNRRDDGGDPLNFAGPKSLAELKGAKVSGSSQEQPTQEQPTKGINAPLAAGHEASEDPLTFEGPKPLSDILKRKRQTASGNDSVLPSSGDESNGRNAKGLADSALAAAAASGVKEGDYTNSGAENLKTQTAGEEEGGGLVPAEGEELPSDANEDQELKIFDTKDGDVDDEAMESEDFTAEGGVNAYPGEGENAYPDDDDEEDDEDDFAKKVGSFFK